VVITARNEELGIAAVAKLAAPGHTSEPFPEQARKTIDTNYLGTKHVIERLLPHMKPGARVTS
jgi:NAD(P)-dependent dehydrogenase (short-subunit alcohol dehydrogenase family)